MPLLEHFGNIDLSNLKSLSDDVYFNMPFFKLVSYPFEWIWPIFILACLFFVGLLAYGFKKKVLNFKGVLIGLLPALLILLINGLAGYLTWPALKWWYAGYNDILHGFTYNGHQYIFEMVMFSLGISFFVYSRFKKIKLVNLMVGPLFIWLILCALLALYLKGGSFFIVPIFGLLASLLVLINQEKPNPLLLLFLCLPAIFMHSPFIQMFPVGLGLKMMTAATLLTSLLFFLTLPLFGTLKRHMTFSIISFALFAIYGIKAHLNSSFSEERPEPSSLLYVYNADENAAQWASYDYTLIDWNFPFFQSSEGESPENTLNTISSKYNTRFRNTSVAPLKNIAQADITITKDTLIGGSRLMTLCYTPKRPINRLEVFTNDVAIEKCTVNGAALSDYFLANRRNGKLVTHFVSDNDYTGTGIIDSGRK